MIDTICADVLSDPASLASWVLDDPAAESDQSYMAIDTQPTSPFKDNIYVVWSEDGQNIPPSALGNTVVGFPLLFAFSDDGINFSKPIDTRTFGAVVESFLKTAPGEEPRARHVG